MKRLKQKILKIASELFSDFGFLGVSMNNIAKKLKITKAALYYHFKSKKEIYLKVLERNFEKLEKFIKEKISKVKSKKEIVKKVIEGYIEFSLKEKNLIKSLILKLPKQDLEIKNYILKSREKINNLFQTHLKKEKNFISFLLGVMDRIIVEASFLKKRLKPKKIVLQILKIFFPNYV